jgi:uncharacterized protein YuzE
MRISYDAEVDALYISFRDTTVTSQEVGEGIAVDYDEQGNLAGVEILDAVARLGGENPFHSIVLEELNLPQAA